MTIDETSRTLLQTPLTPHGFDLPTVDRLLTSTRAARRTLDLTRPVDRQTIEECLDLAVHAPSASNQQRWRWVVVTEAPRRARIAELYQRAFEAYQAVVDRPVAQWWREARGGERRAEGSDQGGGQDLASAAYLARHIAEVPVLVFPCLAGRVTSRLRWASTRSGDPSDLGSVLLASHFGSIFPAVWSFQLALRSRGLGSVLTTLHLRFEEEVRQLLGLPRSFTQTCMVPVAHLRRDLAPGPPRSAAPATRWEHWSAGRRLRSIPDPDVQE